MRKLICLFLFVFLSSSSSYAVDVHKEALNKKLTFSISLPDGYTIKKDVKGGSFSYEIGKNEDSQLLLTLFPGVQITKNELQSLLRSRGTDLLKNAEEEQLTLIDMEDGGRVSGAYFALTDRNPKPDEYKFLWQGGVLAREGLGMFTFLHNSKETEELDTVLTILNSIRIETNTDYASPFDGLRITQDDLQTKVKFGDELRVKTYQIGLYLQEPTIYESIMPKLEDIEIQSIEDGDDKGSVVYLKYEKPLGDGLGFLKGLFYGGAKPGSKEHPELMFHNKDTIVLLCFPTKSKLKKQLKKVIKRKL